MTDNLSIAVQAFASIDVIFVGETLLPRWVKLSSTFREPPLNEYCILQ